MYNGSKQLKKNLQHNVEFQQSYYMSILDMKSSIPTVKEKYSVHNPETVSMYIKPVKQFINIYGMQ